MLEKVLLHIGGNRLGLEIKEEKKTKKNHPQNNKTITEYLIKQTRSRNLFDLTITH